jgi:predicted nucleic acid-binding protein
VIYLDTSVALAYLLAEAKMPPPLIWNGSLVASRLLEYEIWIRLNRTAGAQHEARMKLARELIDRVTVMELTPTVLRRALQPFPLPLKTLDALHIATIEFLRGGGHVVRLASYDAQLARCAEAMGIAIAEF